ncbi:ATP-binding protein [Myroides odoratus]|uniref:Type IV secretory pathway, VirB4 components n=1 Tax=Myroides odoratus TaxID=256 RepID=A0A378RJ07_MYROD|nr:ATP-binding protein [Myroides odoratus]QQU02148.1 ATP-binding protein [Myroides odoratus]STZ26945.1 Type IV secretory pathway, VirB4 components [Myroides odoratus]
MKNNNPFDHSHFIGYVNLVTPQFIKVHFPSSILMKTFTHYGEELKGGLVGNYVVIEGESYGFLGKIIELGIPEKERLELSERSFSTKEFHPIGKVEILMSFDLFNPSKIEKGLNSLPMIGSKVFICSSNFIEGYFKNFGVKNIDAPIIRLGKLTHDNKTNVELSQQALFGRHCAIVGTTGGGKSYTVSKLLESLISNNAKTIIIDPTGEYQSFNQKECVSIEITKKAFFHYSNLTISDLFVMLRPSGQVQAPKLMEAIKSLKILEILKRDKGKGEIDEICEGGKVIGYDIRIAEEDYQRINLFRNAIKKAGELKKPFNRIYNTYLSEIESLNANFDINLLVHQLNNECVYETEFKRKDENNNNGYVEKWGDKNETHLNNLVSLMLRVNNLITNKRFSEVFGFTKSKNEKGELIHEIKKFYKGNKKLLRLSFEKVGYDFQTREILANAIGRYLLESARVGTYKKNPIVLFIDEAHQFLNKKVKDEYFESTDLDSFTSIAKECRKFGLFLCLATQMPRDIPQGTLSQMGTFIVHRLINHYDKEAIANASSSANNDTIAFLPVLGSGEAVLMGVDFPMPIMLKIALPTIKPNSETPLFR